MEQLFDKAVNVGVKSPERDDRYVRTAVTFLLSILYLSMCLWTLSILGQEDRGVISVW